MPYKLEIKARYTDDEYIFFGKHEAIKHYFLHTNRISVKEITLYKLSLKGWKVIRHYKG